MIDSQSYIEKRRGRKEIEVTRRRRGGVKGRETDLASNQFPKCFPEPRTPKDTVGLEVYSKKTCFKLWFFLANILLLL